jgi:hypothetical protein
VIARLTGGNRVVMTTGTNTNNFIVVNRVRRDRSPRRRARLMAGVTSIRSTDMRRRFTAGNGSVMATDARANHLIVVNCAGLYGRPGSGTGLMTGITGIGAVNMIGRFAAGYRAIVATGARAQHFIMIHGAGYHGRPGCRRRFMTRFANIRGRDVRR